MRFTTVFLILAVLTLSGGAQQRPSTSAATGPGRTSVTLFDNLKDGEDYIYLLSNSSFVWGPDPNNPSEEITFTGVVTVPKWPMPGFERRTLPDVRFGVAGLWPTAVERESPCATQTNRPGYGRSVRSSLHVT